MSDIYEEVDDIKISDLDFNNQLKMSSIFNYLQNISTKHADVLKIGQEDMLKENLLWVLSRMNIEVIKYPSLNDKITIRTWPKGTDKLYAIRDFEVYNEKLELIIKATSSWLLLDVNSFRPKRPTIYAKRTKLIDKSAFDEPAQKIKQLTDSTPMMCKIAEYSHLDINKHVNNSIYIDWIFDCLEKDFFKHNVIKSLNINYLSEVKHKEEISIKSKSISTNSFYIEGYNKSTDSISFSSIIEF